MKYEMCDTMETKKFNCQMCIESFKSGEDGGDAFVYNDVNNTVNKFDLTQ